MDSSDKGRSLGVGADRKPLGIGGLLDLGDIGDDGGEYMFKGK